MLPPITRPAPARGATILSLVCLLVAVCAAAVGAHAWLSPAAARPPAEEKEARVETELVTITPTGFDPAEITRPQGRFILKVDNRGGLEEVTLQLDGLRGGREREVRVRRTALDWRDLLDLRPGAYVLREAGHPGWACRITITPR